MGNHTPVRDANQRGEEMGYISADIAETIEAMKWGKPRNPGLGASQPISDAKMASSSNPKATTGGGGNAPPSTPSGNGNGSSPSPKLDAFVDMLKRFFIAGSIFSALGLIVALLGMRIEVSPEGVANIAERQATQRAKAPVDIIDACTRAIKAAEGTGFSPPQQCTSTAGNSAATLQSNHPTGSCSGKPVSRGGSQIWAFKAKSGCSVTVPAGQMAFLAGKFTVKKIEGGNKAQFVRKNCDNWEDDDRMDVNLPLGSESPSTCSRVASPADQASEITLIAI